MTALARTAGAQGQPRGISPRGVCRTPSVRDTAWPLAPAPMAVSCLGLLAFAAIVSVVIMCHDEYRYDGSADQKLVLHCNRLRLARGNKELRWRGGVF